MTIVQHRSTRCVGKIAEILQGDDAPRWSLWLTSPRCEVAYLAYHHGFKQLAALIHRDLASDPTEEFDAGYRIGYRAGRRGAVAS